MKGIITAAALVGAAWAAGAAGVRINTTSSMPLGLWRVAPIHGRPRIGDVVTFCPPENAAVRLGYRRGYIGAGKCPSGTEPLIKEVAAVPGDVVKISAAGIAVNGKAIPHTKALTHDPAGRPLRSYPPGSYRVALGNLWTVAPHNPLSFDSRYFGPVPAANIRGIAHPLAVWW